MEISHILLPEAVKVVGKVSSKKKLFQTLADTAYTIYGLPAGETLDALQEREGLGPTGVGHGVALPHARLKGLEKIVGIFLKLETPMEFNSVDKQPVDLVCALFAPENSGVDHLKALALISRTMRDGDICTKLRANDDINTLHAILSEPQTNHAA